MKVSQNNDIITLDLYTKNFKGEIYIVTQKKGSSQQDLINLTEKALNTKVDIKYYHAVTALLERGYLLDDISAALLMAVSENKKDVKKQPKVNKSQSKKRMVKQPEKKQRNVQPKRTEKKPINQNRKPKRKVNRNENSNS